MKLVPIKEAKTRLTELARLVEQGERVVVTRSGKPAFEMVQPQEQGGIDFEAIKRWKAERGIDRIFGEMSDDFDDPLPEDFLLRPLL